MHTRKCDVQYVIQCRWKLRSDSNDKSGAQVHWRSLVDATGNLQIVLRDKRSVFSVRRTKLLHDVRLVDVQRTSGLPRSCRLFACLLERNSGRRGRVSVKKNFSLHVGRKKNLKIWILKKSSVSSPLCSKKKGPNESLSYL